MSTIVTKTIMTGIMTVTMIIMAVTIMYYWIINLSALSYLFILSFAHPGNRLNCHASDHITHHITYGLEAVISHSDSAKKIHLILKACLSLEVVWRECCSILHSGHMYNILMHGEILTRPMSHSFSVSVSLAIMTTQLPNHDHHQ